jgi:hypothetical protein
MTTIAIDLDGYQMDKIVIESLKSAITDLLDDASPLHEFDAAVRKEQAEHFIETLRYYYGDDQTMEFLKSLEEQ